MNTIRKPLQFKAGFWFLFAFSFVSIEKPVSSLAVGPKVEASARRSSLQVDEPPEEVFLENGFHILFEEVDYNEDGTSTWQYFVEEMPGSKDLGNWVLELPVCAPLVTASPEPWEAVHPDPNAQLSGIKWETGDGFQAGDFSVTVEGQWAAGATRVAAKGPDVAIGEIAGPSCSENQAPQAGEDRVTTEPGAAVTIPVLSNDGDPNGDALSLIDFQSVTAQGGTVARLEMSTPGNTSDDQLQYSPPPGFTGEDQFTYTLSDGFLTEQGTVFIVVVEKPKDPTANPDSYTAQGGSLTVPSPGILANDVLQNGAPPQAVLVDSTVGGTLAFNEDGSFTYTPRADFAGQDAFSYYIKSGGKTSNTAVVTLLVPDVIPPDVAWISPITARGRYEVGEGESVQLEVQAADNQAVASVIFLRWDALNEQYVTIAEVESGPYEVSLDTSELNPAWNQVFAIAYDAAGNASNSQYIWLYKVSNSGAPGGLLFLPILFR